MTNDHVVDNLLVCRASFIVLRPASLHNLELSRGNQRLYMILNFGVLIEVPLGEVLHLRNRKESVVVFEKRGNQRIVDAVHAGWEDTVFSLTRIVLLEGMDPTQVVVRVWHQMDSQLICILLVKTDRQASRSKYRKLEHLKILIF